MASVLGEDSVNIKSQTGAVFVEAALGFLTLIIFILAIIEFARYATYTAVLQAAADEALALAQTVSNLDSTNTTLREGSSTTKGAKQSIREVALRLATKTFFSTPGGRAGIPLKILDTQNNSPVRVTISEPPAKLDSPEQRRKYLEENPMKIEMEAEVPLILGKLLFGKKLRVKASAVGYREPRNPYSEPAPLDCKGNPLPPGTAQPTDCKCPTDTANPDARYDPALSICVCNAPAVAYIASRGITQNLEKSMTYNPSTKKCECPPPYVMKNGKCQCGLTDKMCESAYHDWDKSKTPFGPGAHVRTYDFYYPVCECVPPCSAGDPGNYWAVAGSTWDSYDQRCECTKPADEQTACRNALKTMYPWDTYSKNFAVTESCECRKCGSGRQLDFGRVLTERYTYGCDCSGLSACPSGSQRTNWAGCQCLCDNGASIVRLPNGSLACGAPGCVPGRSCTYDSSTGTIKVCESGGLCSNPLEYVVVD